MASPRDTSVVVFYIPVFFFISEFYTLLKFSVVICFLFGAYHSFSLVNQRFCFFYVLLADFPVMYILRFGEQIGDLCGFCLMAFASGRYFPCSKSGIGTVVFGFKMASSDLFTIFVWQLSALHVRFSISFNFDKTFDPSCTICFMHALYLSVIFATTSSELYMCGLSYRNPVFVLHLRKRHLFYA